jgi:UDP-galactose transporter B1
MLMGTLMGKRYPLRKYLNVVMIVLGVALFMGAGDKKKKGGDADTAADSASQAIGIVLLFVSLCFDGGTGAYEDKLMSVHSVQPFDLMYNIQLGKTILAGVGLLVFNQVHVFLQMIQDMGFLLVALGLTGALGQVFIFVTIAKFGALTCSIIGLARKVTTLVASIYFYGHHLNSTQLFGLVISVGAMVMNFMGKSKKSDDGHGGGGHGNHGPKQLPDEMAKMLDDHDDDEDDVSTDKGLELADQKHRDVKSMV